MQNEYAIAHFILLATLNSMEIAKVFFFVQNKVSINQHFPDERRYGHKTYKEKFLGLHSYTANEHANKTKVHIYNLLMTIYDVYGGNEYTIFQFNKFSYIVERRTKTK